MKYVDCIKTNTNLVVRTAELFNEVGRYFTVTPLEYQRADDRFGLSEAYMFGVVIWTDKQLYTLYIACSLDNDINHEWARATVGECGINSTPLFLKVNEDCELKIQVDYLINILKNKVNEEYITML